MRETIRLPLVGLRRATHLLAGLVLAFTASAAHATTDGGSLSITTVIRTFYQDWVGPIATMLALAGLIWAFLQIGAGRGPEAFGNAIRWLVVVALVVGFLALLTSAGISAATI